MFTALTRGQNLFVSNAERIRDYTNRLNGFKTKFEKLGEIEKGDKIGRNENGNYYIFKGDMFSFQLVKRWWYKEDRTTSFKYIDEDFTKFFSLCDDIKQSHMALTPNATVKKTLVEIITEVIPGLYNLKDIYSAADENANKLRCKIDSIILTLIDIKTEINKNTTSQSIERTAVVLCPMKNTTVPVGVGMAFSL